MSIWKKAGYLTKKFGASTKGYWDFRVLSLASCIVILLAIAIEHSCIPEYNNEGPPSLLFAAT